MKRSLLWHSRSGFTLVELLIGMTIFAIAMTSIYLLLMSTMKSANYSRNEIVVSNLLQEQMELVRNIRDNNIANASAWNAWRIDNAGGTFTGKIVMIENDFSHTGTTFNASGEMDKSPVKITSVTTFSETEKDKIDDNTILKKKFDATQLCFDSQKRYIHCENDAHKTQSGTIFASYANIFPMNYEKDGKVVKIEKDDVYQWFIIDARVIVRDGNNYREYDAKTGITDWYR